MNEIDETTTHEAETFLLPLVLVKDPLSLMSYFAIFSHTTFDDET
jgi:hypothetical protein